MAVPDFPVERIHAIAATSCATWVAVTLAAHFCTAAWWPGYGRLPARQRLAWTNRISSALHAVVLVAAQAPNMGDAQLRADLLFAVNGAHFFWGAVMYGYLAYDTAFTLVFWRAVGAPAFLAHHALGLACCAFGLYGNRMALFGMAIQVFFESTTPLLHLLGCLKIAGRTCSRAYLVAGLALVAQFAVCRVAVGSYYWALMIAAVWRLPAPRPGWALGGVAVFGALIALNTLWLLKLVGLARARMLSGGGGGKAAGLALGLADAAQCKAMAAAAQPSGGASGAGDAASDLIKSCVGVGGGGGVGRVISLSARAGSMSAVEAAAHAAAYAAARAQNKQLPAQEAALRQGGSEHRGAPEQSSEDWMRSMKGEPVEPMAAPAAIGENSSSMISDTSALVGKLQAMPSLMRQGMSGPLEAVSASGSGKWGGAHTGNGCTRRRQKGRCDCAFC